MFILHVNKRYLGRCNLGDPQESTLFRGASSTTKQGNSVVKNCSNTGDIVQHVSTAKVNDQLFTIVNEISFIAPHLFLN